MGRSRDQKDENSFRSRRDGVFQQAVRVLMLGGMAFWGTAVMANAIANADEEKASQIIRFDS